MKTSFLVRGCSLAFCLPLFILAFSQGVGTAHGQTEELPKVDPKNSLVKGAWALQFQINNNFSLSSFQGSTLSAKRHYSNKKAIGRRACSFLVVSIVNNLFPGGHNKTTVPKRTGKSPH